MSRRNAPSPTCGGGSRRTSRGLPVRYFDSTQSGVLVSRVMNDAEGIRNLVGTGLVQLVGSFVTAVAALVILFYLNATLTIITLVVLLTFGAAMWYAFRTVRPVFRERGKIYAEVTGRLTETIGGIRIVKTYTAEKREELVFTTGVHRLFRNVAKTITSVSGITAFGTVVIGTIGLIMIVIGGRAILAGEMTVGEFITYILFTGLMAAPVMQIAADRDADQRGVRRSRPHPRADGDADGRRRGPRTSAAR